MATVPCIVSLLSNVDINPEILLLNMCSISEYKSSTSLKSLKILSYNIKHR